MKPVLNSMLALPGSCPFAGVSPSIHGFNSKPIPSSLYIRPLADGDFHQLHGTLCRGFGVKMSSESLALRLRQNGYRPEISYGAFDDGAMIGFWLSGIRTVSGKKTSCCTGTTVVEQWRNRGIAAAMARSAEGAARSLGASAEVLFAMADNAPVIRLYRNMGFDITRTLRSYSSADFLDLPKDNRMKARVVDLGYAYSLRHMLDHEPPWYRMWQGIIDVKDSIMAVAVRDGAREAAFGVFQPATGRILHVGLDAADEEEGRLPLGAMTAFFMGVPDRTETIELFQVPDSSGRVIAAMESLGFRLFNTQVEMSKEL